MNEDPPKVVDLHPAEWESEKHTPRATMFWDFIGAAIIGLCVLLYKFFTG